MIAADQTMAIGAGAALHRQMEGRIDLETVCGCGAIGGGMQRNRPRLALPPHPFDQAAAFAGKSGPRVSGDLNRQAQGQKQLHLADVACTWPTRWPLAVSIMSISSPSLLRTRRIRRPGWLSMLTILAPGGRANT